MTTYLLDINILLGVVWKEQEAHKTVFPWFQSTGRRRFATCGITQSGFVRLCANAKIAPKPMTMSEALEALGAFTGMPGHSFWNISHGIREAIDPFIHKVFGPMQLTNAYLLGLALANDGILVTRDRAVSQLAGVTFAKHVLLLP